MKTAASLVFGILFSHIKNLPRHYGTSLSAEVPIKKLDDHLQRIP